MSLAPSEIVALAGILEELDYYQLLHLERDASAGEVKRAYHSTSRDFHPDANRSLTGDTRDAVKRVAMRVCEAYAVLRDPRRRQAYDRRLAAGEAVRIQLAAAEAETERRTAQERGGRTPQGRQFFKLAEKDLARHDMAGAARNLQTALTFEPDNVLFKELLQKVKQEWR